VAFLDRTSIERLGFRAVGQNVLVSDKASFYNCANISLGDNVRIDDFCILSAGKNGIEIGRHVHVACYSSLIGAGRIRIGDFANISSRVSIYSSSDDYSGATMTNPTVPAQWTGVIHADVEIGRHVIVGCGSVVLPGTTLGEAAAIGALSLVNRDCAPFCIYGGTPARFIKERKRDLLALEQALLGSIEKHG